MNKPNASRRSSRTKKAFTFQDHLPSLARHHQGYADVGMTIDASMRRDAVVRSVIRQGRESLLSASLKNALIAEEYEEAPSTMEMAATDIFRGDQQSHLFVISVVGNFDKSHHATFLQDNDIQAIHQSLFDYGIISTDNDIMLLPHLFRLEDLSFEVTNVKDLHDDMYAVSQGDMGGLELNKIIESSAKSERCDETTLVNRYLVGIDKHATPSLGIKTPTLRLDNSDKKGRDKNLIPASIDASNETRISPFEKGDVSAWHKTVSDIMSPYVKKNSAAIGVPESYFQGLREGAMAYQVLSITSMFMLALDIHQVNPENAIIYVSPQGEGESAMVMLSNRTTHQPLEVGNWVMMSLCDNDIEKSLLYLEGMAERMGVSGILLHNESEDGPLITMAN